MIRKKIIPIGNVGLSEDGKKVMKITQMIAEYRILGILLYKKELINPSYFLADYFEGFTIDF